MNKGCVSTSVQMSDHTNSDMCMSPTGTTAAVVGPHLNNLDLTCCSRNPGKNAPESFTQGRTTLSSKTLMSLIVHQATEKVGSKGESVMQRSGSPSAITSNAHSDRVLRKAQCFAQKQSDGETTPPNVRVGLIGVFFTQQRPKNFSGFFKFFGC